MKFKRNIVLFITLLSFVNVHLKAAVEYNGYLETSGNDCICDIVFTLSNNKEPVSDNWLWTHMGYKKIEKTSFSKPGGRCGDDGSYELPLGFNFKFYGKSFDKIYVNINGSISFDKANEEFSSQSLSKEMSSIIAGYWADIDLGRTPGKDIGGIYYKQHKDNGVVRGVSILWYNVGCFDEDDSHLATFQITITDGVSDLLPDGKNVSFCYGKLEFAHGSASCDEEKRILSSYGDNETACSTGFTGGVPATVGIVYSENNGDGKHYYYQVGRFDRPTGGNHINKVDYPEVDYPGSNKKRISCDGVDLLINGSKQCQFAYDFSKEGLLIDAKCGNKNSNQLNIYLPFSSNDMSNHSYVIFINDDSIKTVSQNNGMYLREFVELEDVPMYKVLIKEIDENGELKGNYEATVEAPICFCPSDDWDININGEDLVASYCSNKLLEFSTKSKKGAKLTHPKYTWSFSNSESSDLSTPERTYTVASTQRVMVKVVSDECKRGMLLERDFVIDVCPVDSVCPTEFAPTAGKKYILSGWMHVEGAKNVTSYADYGSIEVKYEGSDQVDECTPSGDIIDEWQRIYKEIRIPDKATQLFFVLKSKENGKDCYFDDIRFLPIDASMVSYVYDPVTLRLVAELDNENYATFYEYDEEGALIRVKKETERGIMTIKEARQGGVKLK